MRAKRVVLLVDHNELTLSTRKFMLQTRGYRVLAVRDAEAALEVLSVDSHSAIDLLLAELLLPSMDGNELVRRAKIKRLGLNAMLISGIATSFERATAADVFLPKGACSADEVLARVRMLTTRRRGPKKGWRQHEKVATVC